MKKTLFFLGFFCATSSILAQDMYDKIYLSNYEAGYSDCYRDVTGKRPSSIPSMARQPANNREVVDRKLAYNRGCAQGKRDAEDDRGENKRNAELEFPTSNYPQKSVGEIQAQQNRENGEAVAAAISSIAKDLREDMAFKLSFGPLIGINTSGDLLAGANLRVPFKLFSVEGMYYRPISTDQNRNLLAGIFNIHYTKNNLFLFTIGAGAEYNFNPDEYNYVYNGANWNQDPYYSKKTHFIAKLGVEKILKNAPISFQLNAMGPISLKEAYGLFGINYIIR